MSSNPMQEEKLDPRVRRTRALILQAFSQVLEEKSFQSISIQDITAQAGINRTTFYLHFPDKYALLDTSISQLFRQELEKRTLNTCHFSSENLHSLIITVAEFILRSSTHCAHADQQFEMLVEARVKEQIIDVLQLWGENSNKELIDARTAAIAASWAIYGLALDWSHVRNRPAVESLADKISPLILAILDIPQSIVVV